MSHELGPRGKFTRGKVKWLASNPRALESNGNSEHFSLWNRPVKPLPYPIAGWIAGWPDSHISQQSSKVQGQKVAKRTCPFQVVLNHEMKRRTVTRNKSL